HKLKAAVLSVLLLAAVATGAAYHSLGALARAREGERVQTASREGQPPGKPRVRMARTEPRPPVQMTVVGRVLNPQGKPIANARIAVLAIQNRPVSDGGGRRRNILMGTSAADVEGRFTLALPAIPANRLDRLALIAGAPRRGLRIVGLEPGADR